MAILNLLYLLTFKRHENGRLQMTSGGYQKLIFDKCLIEHYLDTSFNGVDLGGFNLSVASSYLYIYGIVMETGNVS